MLGVYHYYHYSLLPDIQGSFSPPHGVVTSDAIWRAELPLAGNLSFSSPAASSSFPSSCSSCSFLQLLPLYFCFFHSLLFILSFNSVARDLPSMADQQRVQWGNDRRRSGDLFSHICSLCPYRVNDWSHRRSGARRQCAGGVRGAVGIQCGARMRGDRRSSVHLEDQGGSSDSNVWCILLFCFNVRIS